MLVRDGMVIGAGRHRRCGGPHGEIEALTDCQNNGYDATGATAYVTLAPCTRQGRTPAQPQVIAAVTTWPLGQHTALSSRPSRPPEVSQTMR